jgi:hypothetical protein
MTEKHTPYNIDLDIEDIPNALNILCGLAKQLCELNSYEANTSRSLIESIRTTGNTNIIDAIKLFDEHFNASVTLKII